MFKNNENYSSFPFMISLYISIIAVSLAILHLLSSSTYVDTIIILLIVIIVVVWLPNLKSIELPGGAKLELDRLKEMTDEVIGDNEPIIQENKELPIYQQIFEINPNLTFVYFRIEIEVRIRELAEKNNIKSRWNLKRTLNELGKNGILPSEFAAHGLYELIDFGNKAAHGYHVSHEAAEFMLDVGPKIIAILDEILAS